MSDSLRSKRIPYFETIIQLASALNIEFSDMFTFSHQGKPAKDMKAFIVSTLKDSDPERLKMTAKIVKAIYH